MDAAAGARRAVRGGSRRERSLAAAERAQSPMARMMRVVDQRRATMHAEHASWLERIAQRTCAWSERWIPDAYVFAAAAVVLVALAAMLLGASPVATASAFGDGFWSLIPFTMQMSFIVIGGYVVASSPPAQRGIER